MNNVAIEDIDKVTEANIDSLEKMLSSKREARNKKVLMSLISDNYLLEKALKPLSENERDEVRAHREALLSENGVIPQEKSNEAYERCMELLKIDDIIIKELDSSEKYLSNLIKIHIQETSKWRKIALEHQSLSENRLTENRSLQNSTYTKTDVLKGELKGYLIGFIIGLIGMKYIMQ